MKAIFSRKPVEAKFKYKTSGSNIFKKNRLRQYLNIKPVEAIFSKKQWRQFFKKKPLEAIFQEKNNWKQCIHEEHDKQNLSNKSI